MTDQKRHEDMNRAHKNPASPDKDKDKRNAGRKDPEPIEEDRFDPDRVNRDRSAVESRNQGQGPMNVGDQSRTR